jgi:hypothetical protein
MALVVLAVIALMNLAVVDISNLGNARLVKTETTMEMSEIDSFNNSVVSGSAVISAIDKRKSLYSEELIIVVNIDDSQTVYDDSTPSAIRNPENNNYINPTNNFSSELIKDDNGIVVGISFTQIE